MKKLLAIALTISAATAFAEVDNNHEYCKSMSGLAESIMEHRQEGTSVVTLMETASLPLAKLIIKDAYSRPKFSSPKYQRQAINEFRDDYYITCRAIQEK